jgi:serine protease Do
MKTILNYRSTLRSGAIFLALVLVIETAFGQSRNRRLPDDYFKSGPATMEALAPVAQGARASVLKLEIDERTVAFATVIEASGLALTKASEVREGEVKARTSGDETHAVEVLVFDDENDVALIRVAADGLAPIEWTVATPEVGQWAITAGIGELPEALGIVSVAPRRILHKRALIGVELDFRSPDARITRVMKGLGAEKAGLKEGDVILSVNETQIKRSEELTSTLRAFREGQSVKLRVLRGPDQFDASVEMMVPAPEQVGRGPNRQERMNRMGGELSRRAEGFRTAIQHDGVLLPSQCGGPLLGLDGKAIGLNIARAGRIASYALPAATVKEIIEELTERTRVSVEHRD